MTNSGISGDQRAATEEWFSKHTITAMRGLGHLGIEGFMEAKIALTSTHVDIEKKDLRDYAQRSTIKTFGWPIGIVLANRDEYKPRPDEDGIYAEIAVKEPSWEDEGKTYDYWALNANGSFYLLQSLFEDERKPGHIFFNTRIVRITEVLLYTKKLYTLFGVGPDARITVTIKHGGLTGRKLSASSPGRRLSGPYRASSEMGPTTIDTSIGEIESSLVDVVEKFTKPLFEMFDFFELSRTVLEDIVVNFEKGRVV